jgi:hypothetical protein
MPPRLPASFTCAHLEAAGFVGWRTWDGLRSGALAEVPAAAGVYLVYRTSSRRPTFLAVGTGGSFKGRDPNVTAETLQAKWVPGAHVVYIGKADTLAGRLRLYARFGAGQPTAHWGGRYIWQIPAAQSLLAAWRALNGPSRARDDEIRLLGRFRELHDGRLPFANLTA